MKKPAEFKWKHYEPEMILLTVRWYLRYNLSFRDLVEIMEERGLFHSSHNDYALGVHQYGPELDERVRRHLKPTNDSWRFDETCVKVKGQWMYLYRAVDSEGNRSDAYHEKRTICFTGPVCPKSSEVYSSTIWNGCIRTDSIRNLYTFFQINAIFAPEPVCPSLRDFLHFVDFLIFLYRIIIDKMFQRCNNKMTVKGRVVIGGSRSESGMV
jgi:hypothetical protein